MGVHLFSAHWLQCGRDRRFLLLGNWWEMWYITFCLWRSSERSQRCIQKRTIIPWTGFTPSAAITRALRGPKPTQSGRKHQWLSCFVSRVDCSPTPCAGTGSREGAVPRVRWSGETGCQGDSWRKSLRWGDTGAWSYKDHSGPWQINGPRIWLSPHRRRTEVMGWEIVRVGYCEACGRWILGCFWRFNSRWVIFFDFEHWNRPSWGGDLC